MCVNFNPAILSEHMQISLFRQVVWTFNQESPDSNAVC